MQNSVVDAFAAAVAARDFDAQRALRAPAVRFRGLTPKGLREADTAEGAVGWLRRWFGDADRWVPVAGETAAVADRYRATWRVRLREDGGWYDVEQSAYCTVEEGRITVLDLVCTGFRPAPTLEQA